MDYFVGCRLLYIRSEVLCDCVEYELTGLCYINGGHLWTISVWWVGYHILMGDAFVVWTLCHCVTCYVDDCTLEYVLCTCHTITTSKSIDVDCYLVCSVWAMILNWNCFAYNMWHTSASDICKSTGRGGRWFREADWLKWLRPCVVGGGII